MSTHIMVDIETLGVDNAPPVLQIAAMEFDLDTGTVYETFNQVADITSLKNVSMDTLDWWLRTAEPMYVDSDGETKQVGLVITASTDFSNSCTYSKQYIELWTEILTIVDTEF